VYRAAHRTSGEPSDTTVDHSGRAPSFSTTAAISQGDQLVDNEMITSWPFRGDMAEVDVTNGFLWRSNGKTG